MDVHCSTCREPWDTFHLTQDAIYDTGLSHDEASAWRRLPSSEKLAPRYRAEFTSAGWQFGATLLNVIRCPGCRQGDQPDPETLYLKASIEEILGDDFDALAAHFNDHQL